MCQTKQGIQSTKQKDEENKPQIINEPQPRVQEIQVKVEDIKHIMYTNQTGPFPVMSSQRNRYIMVLCKTDRNPIPVEPMTNRTSGEMCKAYITLMRRLKQSGITVKKHILGNEASEEFLQTIKQHGIEYQKVPPHIHCQNAAEKAISTFKDHFITTLWRSIKIFQFTCGTGYYRRQRAHYVCEEQQTLHPEFWYIPTCMDITTSTECP